MSRASLQADSSPPNDPGPNLPANPAPSPPTPLPPLSSPDRALLLQLFSLRDDLDALALHSGRDLIDLYAWATSPAIAPWLAFRRHARAQSRHEAALAALTELLADSADPHNPVERRRCASTILRCLHGALRAPASRREHLTRSRPVPPPLTLPSPDLDDSQTVRQILASLQHSNPRAVLSTLHAHAAPGAEFFSIPIPADPAAFVHSPHPTIQREFREPITHFSLSKLPESSSSTPSRDAWMPPPSMPSSSHQSSSSLPPLPNHESPIPSSPEPHSPLATPLPNTLPCACVTYHALLSSPGSRPFHWAFTLTRAHPHPHIHPHIHPWLLARIDRLIPDSS